MRRLAQINETSETWRGLEQRAADLADLIGLADDEGDASIAEDIKRDLATMATELDRLQLELTFSGPYDSRSAILAIHAGAGGTESQDWAEMLLRMYVRWAERRGYHSQVLELTAGEEAGLKSVTVEVRGHLGYGYLKAERGVHRLVRLSPFDADHARHTSFALIEVMPEAESAAEVTLEPDDLRIDVFRASGHGGQHVQKNATAVRITHLPTGLVVVCQNERSQGRNKESAMRVLEARLLERELARQEEERAKIKGKHISPGWGNQIRSYILHPYKMVKDHRTDFESSDPEAVLDGDLDPFINAYLTSTLGNEGT